MKFLKKLFKTTLATLSALFILGISAVLGVYLYLSPDLPSIETLKEVKLQVPLRVYTADKKLISEFGEMKRSPLTFDEIPQSMIDAILSAEDNRYFEHPGVDYQGILRAVINLAMTGKKSQGGSTITMQVARNFFLSSEKTYLRKINEIFLSFKIENELSKEEILELYLNKIYLGHRSYGIAAAAQVYYGKTMEQLSIAEMAMIAGLPKAPSRFNPVTNLKRAVMRRNYVLGRMHALNYIDTNIYEDALNTEDNAKLHGLSIEISAPHVAEMVRSQMVKQYGDEQTYTGGYKVITTIDSRLQVAANNALRRALLDYDSRHGYRGTLGHVDFSNLPTIESWSQLFKRIPKVGYLTSAVVLALEEQAVTVMLNTDTNLIAHIPWGGLSWARTYINDNRRGPKLKIAANVLKEGDLIYLQRDPKHGWRLSQPPQTEGALISISAHDGHIIALNGGYDFHRSNFNRVTQAFRQPGSNFKPFIYSAALEK
ncbi:Multimodular transpeptidase-transglycosylase, partial [hydrothermal vent metagenome]